MQIELRSWTFQQVLRIFKALYNWNRHELWISMMFFGACYSERGDLHFWPHLRRRKQKPPRKTGQCSRRKRVTSIQFSLMLNANPVLPRLSCDHFDVRIPGICRPKVSPGATFHTFSGNFSPFTSTVICLQSLQQFFPCSWFQLSDLSHFFSSFEKLPGSFLLSIHGRNSSYQLGIGPSTAVLLRLPHPPYSCVVHLSGAVQEEGATCRWVRVESVEI